MGYRWTREQDALLDQHDDETVAELTGHTVYGVVSRREVLAGTHDTDRTRERQGQQRLYASCPTEGAKKGPWTAEEDALVADTDLPLWEVARRLNRRYVSVSRRAQHLGVNRKRSPRRPELVGV